MRVLLAYWSVVVIWSTTPMAIAISNSGFSFWSAGGLRLLLATTVIMIIVTPRRAPFFPNRYAPLAYGVAAMGLGPQMCLVYWAAQYVPSGVVSIIFSLSPCFTYLASLIILRDSKLSARRVFALICAVLGMVIIYLDQLDLNAKAALGLAALLLSTSIFALSSVCLKKLNDKVQLDPFCQTGGTLLFTLPIIGTAWFVFEGKLPTEIHWPAISAVAYLAICGSVMGFTLYFYILRRMNVVTVSLITLITPVIAIGIGVLILDEVFTWRLALGASVVLCALALFEGVGVKGLPWRNRRQRKVVTKAIEAAAP